MKAQAVRATALQMVRFGAVGVAGTIVHYALLIGLVEWIGAKALYASGVGFAAGAFTNYVMARRFVFQSDARHRVALPRFLTVAAVGAVINLAVFGAMQNGLRAHYLAAQVIATLLVFVFGYVANRVWTFRPS